MTSSQFQMDNELFYLGACYYNNRSGMFYFFPPKNKPTNDAGIPSFYLPRRKRAELCHHPRHPTKQTLPSAGLSAEV